MGMAASQARFLGLTARKSNVEFEGQQVNQQRTTLANQSANYYNDLLGMSVPTPPSVDSFTKTVYSFTDGALTNQVTALMAKQDGWYQVSYLQQYEDDFTPVSAGTSIVTRTGDGSTEKPYKYLIGSTELRKLGTGIGVDGSYSGNDEYLKSLTNEQRKKLKDEEISYKQLLQDKGTGDYFVRYVQNTSTGVYQPYFYNADEVEGAVYDPNTNASLSAIKVYQMGTATKTTEVKGKDAQVEKDSTGRMINITIYEDKNDLNSGVKYSLTTSTVTDQDAYEDAMNQYEYDKALYDQAIDEINSKIEIIQAEDKNLELRLKQLDTEQEAIQTEIDSVTKVVDKNIEKSFGAFA